VLASLKTVRVPSWALFLATTAACLALLATRMPLQTELRGSQVLIDGATYLAATKAVANGESPYHQATLALHVDAAVTNVYPYVYTPVLAIMLQPMACLGLASFQSIWIVVSSIAAGFLVLLLVAALPLTPHSKSNVWKTSVTPLQALAGLALIGFLPIHFTLVMGQMEIFTVLLLIGALRFHFRRQALVAGLLLGSMLVVKHASVLLLPFFLLTSTRSTVAYAVATVAAVVGVTLSLGYGSLWTDFLQWSSAMSYSNATSMGFHHSPFNISIGALFVRMGLRSDVWFTLPGAAFWGVTVLAVAWLTWRKSVPLVPAYTAIALASILALPFAWTHHLMYLAPACAAVVFTRVAEKSSRSFIFAFLAVILFVPGMPLTRAMRLVGIDPISDLVSSSVTTALAAIVCLALWRVYSGARGTNEAPAS
jgi:hypothetical protein